MKRSLLLPRLIGLLACASLAGCAVPDGGYGYGYGGGLGANYYQPYAFDYGGWGPGYNVGPYRGGYHRDDHFGGEHAWRGPPPGRGMPSLPGGRFAGGPGRGGGGGGHGGGGHAGGGGGGHGGGR
jgi:hypothetical protein